MSDQLQVDVRNSGLFFFWLLALLSIALLSLYGRSLQLTIMNHLSMEQLGFYLGGALVGVVLVLLSFFRSGLDRYGYHLIWVAPLSILLYIHLPFVEKVHVALFGALGFLSQRIFTQIPAALIAISVGVLDELFQHFLPLRVGDWRDVWLNIFAVSLGMFLAALCSAEGRKAVSKGADE